MTPLERFRRRQAERDTARQVELSTANQLLRETVATLERDVRLLSGKLRDARTALVIERRRHRSGGHLRRTA